MLRRSLVVPGAEGRSEEGARQLRSPRGLWLARRPSRLNLGGATSTRLKGRRSRRPLLQREGSFSSQICLPLNSIESSILTPRHLGTATACSSSQSGPFTYITIDRFAIRLWGRCSLLEAKSTTPSFLERPHDPLTAPSGMTAMCAFHSPCSP